MSGALNFSPNKRSKRSVIDDEVVVNNVKRFLSVFIRSMRFLSVLSVLKAFCIAARMPCRGALPSESAAEREQVRAERLFFMAQVLSQLLVPRRRWAYTVRPKVFSGMNGDPVGGILFNHVPFFKGE